MAPGIIHRDEVQAEDEFGSGACIAWRKSMLRVGHKKANEVELSVAKRYTRDVTGAHLSLVYRFGTGTLTSFAFLFLNGKH